MNISGGVRRVALTTLAMTILAACGNNQAALDGAAPPPPEVGVVTVKTTSVPLTAELPGRLEATRVAEVRARAAGIILAREFHEGSIVEEGAILYRIDPAPLEAALRSAEAALAKAKASAQQARLKAERYKPLLKSKAVSQEDYEIAVAVRDQAVADVAAAAAARDTARLNLGYATVTSPIGGQIGRALVTEGALVGQDDATHLATVQQLDPIYVNLSQSSVEALRLRRAMERGDLHGPGEGEVSVEIITEDGQLHAHNGELLFSDMRVDPRTGAILLRAQVPNPDYALLPGMYVRARLIQAVDRDAITIPQQAVLHDVTGTSVLVIDESGKAAQRRVEVDVAYRNQWVIREGLQPGDTVIVDGVQKVRPGAPVTPVPWENPLAKDTPAAGQQHAAALR